METAIRRLRNAALGLFTCFDLIGGAAIRVGISAGFLPLFAAAASAEQARVLATTLDRWAARVRSLVPSTDPRHVSFEPLRYWRGPVWAVVNWMIAEGFADAGNATMAARIRGDTRQLIDAGGLPENFDPTDGKGVGVADFSWTAAIWLLLEDEDSTWANL
jgi:hypothetical protein